MIVFYQNWRLFLIITFFVLAFGGVITRMIMIQTNQGLFLQSAGNAQNQSIREISVKRGTIFDRNGTPLAISITGFDLFALSGLEKKDFDKLFQVIDLEKSFEDINTSKKSLIQKNLTFEEQRKVLELQIDRIELEKTYTRHYPMGEQIAPLIGFSGRDQYGLEGLEKSFNSLLAGKVGSEKILKDVYGRPLDHIEILEPSIASKDLHISIDSNIQYMAYKHLIQSIKSHQATAGTVVILDNATKQVLALASYPSYNPNSPQRKIQKNRVFLETYEPGSIVKPIALAGVLEHNLLAIDDEMEVPIKITVDGNIINDRKQYGSLKVYEIIQESSQVGATKIALLAGRDLMIENYQRFGFSKPIHINFPSTGFGDINTKDDMTDIEVATLGYGYGLTASPFQIAQAYAVFANEGIYHDYQLVLDEMSSQYYEPIISKQTADDVLTALYSVTTDGTGKLANVKGFSIAGKTGTTEKLQGGNYKSSTYTSSFVGIGPDQGNTITIFVNIDNLGANRYSGGQVAAPLFQKIATDVYAYLGYFEDNDI